MHKWTGCSNCSIELVKKWWEGGVVFKVREMTVVKNAFKEYFIYNTNDNESN